MFDDDYFDEDDGYGQEMGVSAKAVAKGASVVGKLFRRLAKRARKPKTRLGKKLKKAFGRIGRRIRKRRKARRRKAAPRAVVPAPVVPQPKPVSVTKPGVDIKTIAVVAGLALAVPYILKSLRK